MARGTVVIDPGHGGTANVGGSDANHAVSTTRDEAVTRWREFLQKHLPANGEYEDGFQRDYVRAAQYELMRLEYLLGHDKEGDALLQQLEDVGGQ